ncbi:MAG: lysostaphin resistance A-like protein, partial [Rubrobacter sp.]
MHGAAGGWAVRRLADRRPLLFSLLLVLVLFGLTVVSRTVFPSAPVGNIKRLPERAFEPPSGMGLIFSDLRSPDTLFWALTILLGLGLLAWLGWLRDAGFNRPSRWNNLRLLWFPLLVSALTLSGGVFVSGATSLASVLLVGVVATVGEEVLFRGVVWRALVPRGPVHAMVLTSLLSGVLVLGRTATDGPWPEAVRLTALALCGGFTYAALRWRTTSIWPVILIHTAFAFATDIATLGTITYPLMILFST